MNYWERWIGDWKRKTAHLCAEAKGIYGELLDHQYATEERLPEDFDECCRIAGATTAGERASVKKVLSRFFPDGMNPRVEQEIQKRRAFVAKKKDAARNRWDKERAEAAAPPNKGNGKHPPAPAIALPDWLAAESFNDWIASRPARARTRSAKLAAIDKLAKLREQGHDPNAIVQESLANGWQGIFAPDAKKHVRDDPLQRDSRCAAISNGERCRLDGVSSEDGHRWYCREHAK